MTDNYRRERIERLLKELEYEICRGMMEREIEETLDFRFCVPVSTTFPTGVVQCEFRTRPRQYPNFYSLDEVRPARLTVVDNPKRDS